MGEGLSGRNKTKVVGVLFVARRKSGTAIKQRINIWRIMVSKKNITILIWGVQLTYK